MTPRPSFVPVFLVALCWCAATATPKEAQNTGATPRGALDGERHRVLVSTDIGGTDPDDFQSMVHLLVYADVLEIEGLLSSPYGPGRKEHILEVIDCYEKDYPNLKRHSDRYPTPAALRAITMQGETETAPYDGVRHSTEGSEWIVKCARRNHPRPLHVLVWGGIEDLAQALHDAPDILPKLRVYYIGGPNKKWSPDAYQYIATHHPTLWMIEANSTYRGWFVGGTQQGEWGSQDFVARHVSGHGALGDIFVRKKSDIKMGDTPSVAWLLKGTPDDPSQPGWGGQFVRAWERPYFRFDRLTTQEDRMEIFGILELVLPLSNAPANAEARLIVENQSLIGHVAEDKTMRFRFCPKAPRACNFTIRANVPSLDGLTGGITAVLPPASVAKQPSARFPNWWTDDPQFAEGPHHGAKTVSRWREEFLKDFALRMDRCQARESNSRSDTAEPIGFATVAGSASGGGAGKKTTVTSFAELKAAAQDEAPRVIMVIGTIKTTEGGGFPLEIRGNKSLIGADKHATIYGGISIKNASNVIVRNLNIQGTWPKPGPDDTIAVRDSHHVWLNHLNIWDSTDGHLDITSESSYVTVSWCKFWYTDETHPHRLCALIGSGGGDHPEDWGKLKVTYHHNWFADRLDQRMPRLMYGQAHLFNNYYTAAGNSYCIGVGSYGAALIENNYFKDVKDPHRFMYDVFCEITARGNIYDNTSGRQDQGRGGTRTVSGQEFSVTPLTKPPYAYRLDKAEDVPGIVARLAGPQ